MPGTHRYVVVDVFTETPLQGNPLAVFTNAQEIPDDLLQPIARELNLSETVFVYPPGYRTPSEQAQAETAGSGDLRKTDETVLVHPPEQGGHARIRIFTPNYELPFAGHPTLGTAFVLGQPLQLGEIRLETKAGVVPVRLEREGPKIVFGRMEQPLPTWQPFERADALLAALGVERSELPVEVYDNGIRHAFVVLSSKEEVARLRPDQKGLSGHDLVGALVAAGAGASWKMRMFSPDDGIGEDAATGSAAGPLACHLARHGVVPWGTEVEIEQGTELGRRSRLHARADGAGSEIVSVAVGGSAVTVARGEFRIP